MDLFILKTDVEKFTSTNKKTLHLIFNTPISNYYLVAVLCMLYISVVCRLDNHYYGEGVCSLHFLQIFIIKLLYNLQLIIKYVKVHSNSSVN